MSAAIWDEPPVRPLMTLRVSRDSGRTWADRREIWPDDCYEPPWALSGAWPPCTCPRHSNGTEISR